LIELLYKKFHSSHKINLMECSVTCWGHNGLYV